MILAIGNSGLWEVKMFDLVRQELQKRGKTAVLFKQDKCLEDEYMNFEVTNGLPKYTMDIDGKSYNINDFSAIWYLKPHLPRKLLEFKPEKYRHFIHKQFYEMRQAIWTLFSDKKWIDNPWAIYKAENKIYQLHIASQYFTIPDTLVTSDPVKVKSFYNKNNGKIIVKTLALAPMIDKVLYTNRITEELIVNIDSLKMSPSIFQTEICFKSHELRVVVVNNQIFAVKIDSQQDEQTALDWRKKPKIENFEIKMTQTELPEYIESQIHKFMNVLGLQFGCIDMAVTSSGEYIFFEINPNGQWYFVQANTGAQIAKSIAKLLV
ncbi:hypothetical protein KKD57_06125 [Patescibacteria group bacterium]|nr:hypothetical protein [Patescibacteria group bacterium]MBU4142313.1 hypothetical protein [Patescibacteria group bacterium]MBU4339096.1 hypothetical protein [Patescibacteria group bacterium]MCG2694772.1 hypothetical protein [Candidatus Parcubacteria bacterium]